MKYKEMLLRIKNSEIVKLATGSVIAQIIAIIASPITTRLYTPDQLGIYTLLLTVVTLFGPLLSGKIEMAIVTEKEEKNVYAVIVLSLILCFIFSIVTTILYTIYLVSTHQFTNEYIVYVIIIFIYMLITGVTNILISYNNRNREYDTISSVYVIRTAIQNIGLILFGFIHLSVFGMLLSQVLGSLFGIKKQANKLIPNRNKLKQVEKKEIKNVLKRNYKLMLYTAPSAFCNSASYSLINFFITAIYGNTIFGYYSLSYRILGIPLSLISINVSKIFFERATNEMNSTKSFKNTLQKITKLLICLSIPMVVILLVIAPELCKIVFGEDWVVSGQYIQILVFMFGIRLVVSAIISPALVIAKKQSTEMKMQILFLISSVLIYIISKYMKLNIYAFLIMISISYSIIYIIMYIYICQLSKGKEVIKNEN